jgi:hypothetical protein
MTEEEITQLKREVEELKRWKAEAMVIINKLNAYMDTRTDIHIGDSKVDKAIEFLKEHERLTRKRPKGGLRTFDL